MKNFSCVIKRSGTKVKFNKNRIKNAMYRAAVAVGGRDKEPTVNLTKQVVEILQKRFSSKNPPHVEDIQDTVEQVLIKNGHDEVAKAYILYRHEQNQKRSAKNKKSSHPSENIPWPKLWKVLDWATTNNLNTIKSMNKRIQKGEFSHIVHESETAYENEVDTAADLILQKRDEIKTVFISGPSSSGKTTTTEILEERLEKHDISFVTLNVDNYFFDLEMHPKDEFGDYDFETPQALDLELINEHLLKLIEGEEVVIPFYDFTTGTRQLNNKSMQLKENEILLIDSLHGLYPGLSGNLPDRNKFKLYLEPLLQMKDAEENFIRWSDLRLIRRMLRDSMHRAYNPQQTLEHWHYVRSSEIKYIFPYIHEADYIINSAMPYELALYSSQLLEDFKQWSKKLKDDPLKSDAAMRANRIKKVLQAVTPIEDDSAVPKNSVMREFIGESN